ncbi:YdcF family protein [Ramlibacter sp. PS4R-6]|uniref:YdcF family protein n=1 Tax=Ramlibacter sp. PS4R-6 TaxID=3133438 RepID=UPI0030B18F7B
MTDRSSGPPPKIPVFHLAKLTAWLIAPLTWVIVLWVVCCAFLFARRVRAAATAGCLGLAVLWIASLPVVAHALAAHLEGQHPALTAAQTATADAIVVLGGAVSGAHPPVRPTLQLGSSSTRVWHAAQLYRAGKAPWVIVAGGNQPGRELEQIEAEAIVEVLAALGVPRHAIRAEKGSRNTWENAANSLGMVQSVPARRVLLVTSAMHMPRALATFRKAWAGTGIEIVPAATDVVRETSGTAPKLWIPDASALAFVTRALREYAGSLVISTM